MTGPGPVVVVTGAARGIGAATARAFAAEGARLALVDVDEAALAGVARAIQDGGRPALPLTADVTSPAHVTRLAETVLTRFGRLDVLVNNAGGFSAIRATEAIEDAEWEAILRSNLTSVFLCCRAAVPVMRRQGGGRIVNVASVAGRGGAVRVASHYAAAKAGVIGFTRHLALEVAGDGITVNAVAPGTTATERVLALRTPEETRRLAERIPAGRLGDPAEIAAAIVFLASPAAAFVTGAVLDVNGGQLMA